MSLNLDSMHELHPYSTITQAHSEALVIHLWSDAYRARSLKSSLLQEHLRFHQSMAESHSAREVK